uniref:VWFA domain-containing protein n=1 Tax=Panagrolaimus sp. PS1159 TaxID=55785 RepID=A0AC35GLE2_9BILA
MLIYGLFLAISFNRFQFSNGEEPQQQPHRLDASLQRFSSQINKIFDEQSRFDLVEKGISEQIQGKINSRTLDFDSTSNEVYKKIQKLLETKIKVLQNIVEVAEETSKDFVYDGKWIHDAVVSKFRPPLPGEDPTKFEKECAAYLKKMAKVDVFNVTKNNDATKTAIHVNVESFKCGKLKKFKTVNCSNEKMEQMFKSNQAFDPTLTRQYFGTYSGLTKMMPAIKWLAEPAEVTMDLYDPRYRPWFIGAETAPKDIIFLIDYSGSVKGQTLHLTKITIRHVLMTLNAYDYFTAIWYNSKFGYVMQDCSNGTFLPATSRNKRLLLTMLDKIEERDQASLPQALNTTFDHFSKDFDKSNDKREKLKKNLGDVEGSGGHKIVLLFTDGIENWPTEVIEKYIDENPNDAIRVFGFSMGYGIGAMPPLDHATCLTKGNYAIVDSIMDVRLQSKSYVSKLSDILALVYKEKPLIERPVTFVVPYMDVQGSGALFSVSMPILNQMENATSGFLAIAGVDISFSQLREILPTNNHLYSFIIDSNGIVFFHPKLRIPKRETYAVRRTACYNIQFLRRHGTRVPYGTTDERVMRMLGLVDSIATTDIFDLENVTKKFAEFRRSMIDGICKGIIEDGPRAYRCFKIQGTPLTLAFVYNRLETIISMPPPFPGARPKLTYLHRDLIGWLIADKTICPFELGAYGPLERFEPFIFGDHQSCPKPADKFLPFAFIRSIQEWEKSWPTLDENSTCLTNPLPFNLYPKYFISAFVQFFQGITVFYPKCNSEYVRDFTNNYQRFSSLQSTTKSGKIFINHEPFSGSVTATKAINDVKFPSRIASIGIQWSYSFLNDLFFNVTTNDPGWKDCLLPNRKCLLISNEAFIVGGLHGGNLGLHLSEFEPKLFAHLINLTVIKKVTFRDYQSDCPMEKRGAPILSGSPPNRPPIKVLIQKFLASIYSLLAFDLIYFVREIFARPIITNGNCHYETPENVEQCTLEFNKYSINLDKTILIHLSANSGCPGSLTIMPLNDINLNVFILDSICYNSKPPTTIQKTNNTKLNNETTIIQQHKYTPFRIPDCQLTNQNYRRLRTDLDYTRFHHAEPEKECVIAAAATNLNNKILIATFFIVIILFY